MRTMVNVEIDTATGNDLIAQGRMGEVMDRLVGALNPEVAYFYERNGHRALTLVVDLADSASLPGVAEPFWIEFAAHVEVIPCMTADELGEGLRRMQ